LVFAFLEDDRQSKKILERVKLGDLSIIRRLCHYLIILVLRFGTLADGGVKKAFAL